MRACDERERESETKKNQDKRCRKWKGRMKVARCHCFVDPIFGTNFPPPGHTDSRVMTFYVKKKRKEKE